MQKQPKGGGPAAWTRTCDLGATASFASSVVSCGNSVDLLRKEKLQAMVVEAHHKGLASTLTSLKDVDNIPDVHITHGGATWELEGTVNETLLTDFFELDRRLLRRPSAMCLVTATKAMVIAKVDRKVLLYVCPGKIKVVKGMDELLQKVVEETGDADDIAYTLSVMFPRQPRLWPDVAATTPKPRAGSVDKPHMEHPVHAPSKELSQRPSLSKTRSGQTDNQHDVAESDTDKLERTPIKPTGATAVSPTSHGKLHQDEDNQEQPDKPPAVLPVHVALTDVTPQKPSMMLSPQPPTSTDDAQPQASEAEHASAPQEPPSHVSCIVAQGGEIDEPLHSPLSGVQRSRSGSSVTGEATSTRPLGQTDENEPTCETIPIARPSLAPQQTDGQESSGPLSISQSPTNKLQNDLCHHNDHDDHSSSAQTPKPKLVEQGTSPRRAAVFRPPVLNVVSRKTSTLRTKAPTAYKAKLGEDIWWQLEDQARRLQCRQAQPRRTRAASVSTTRTTDALALDLPQAHRVSETKSPSSGRHRRSRHSSPRSPGFRSPMPQDSSSPGKASPISTRSQSFQRSHDEAACDAFPSNDDADLSPKVTVLARTSTTSPPASPWSHTQQSLADNSDWSSQRQPSIRHDELLTPRRPSFSISPSHELMEPVSPKLDELRSSLSNLSLRQSSHVNDKRPSVDSLEGAIASALLTESTTEDDDMCVATPHAEDTYDSNQSPTGSDTEFAGLSSSPVVTSSIKPENSIQVRRPTYEDSSIPEKPHPVLVESSGTPPHVRLQDAAPLIMEQVEEDHAMVRRSSDGTAPTSVEERHIHEAGDDDSCEPDLSPRRSLAPRSPPERQDIHAVTPSRAHFLEFDNDAVNSPQSPQEVVGESPPPPYVASWASREIKVVPAESLAQAWLSSIPPTRSPSRHNDIKTPPAMLPRASPEAPPLAKACTEQSKRRQPSKTVPVKKTPPPPPPDSPSSYLPTFMRDHAWTASNPPEPSDGRANPVDRPSRMSQEPVRGTKGHMSVAKPPAAMDIYLRSQLQQQELRAERTCDASPEPSKAELEQLPAMTTRHFQADEPTYHPLGSKHSATLTPPRISTAQDEGDKWAAPVGPGIQRRQARPVSPLVVPPVEASPPPTPPPSPPPKQQSMFVHVVDTPKDRAAKLMELREKKLKQLHDRKELAKPLKADERVVAAPSGPLSGVSNTNAKPMVGQYLKPTSNRQLIQNALETNLLAGTACEAERAKVVQTLVGHPADNFVVTFKGSVQEMKMTFKGLYALEKDYVHKIYGQGPAQLQPTMVKQFFRYNSGKKAFLPVSTRSFTIKTDGAALTDDCFKKKKLDLF